MFLSYTVRRQRKQLSHVLRYRLDDDGVLDRGSGRVLIELPQPGPNHNGGHVVFGPDGYLYIGFGDGQLDADPDNYSQRLDTLLGKILRIDVNTGEPYAVPPDNPFVGGDGRPEIWAYGLRNPWRFSFDSVTGELWAGDVGQADAEEIDRVVKGGNYGWSARQGSRCYIRRRGCDRPEYIDPVTEYDHTQGMAVAGGYVYRGWRLFPLLGAYLFRDLGSGRTWSLVCTPPHRSTSGRSCCAPACTSRRSRRTQRRAVRARLPEGRRRGVSPGSRRRRRAREHVPGEAVRDRLCRRERPDAAGGECHRLPRTLSHYPRTTSAWVPILDCTYSPEIACSAAGRCPSSAGDLFDSILSVFASRRRSDQ